MSVDKFLEEDEKKIDIIEFEGNIQITKMKIQKTNQEKDLDMK